MTEHNRGRPTSPPRTLRQLVATTAEELDQVDPVEANLLVAAGTPPLGHLDIPAYQRIVDDWAEDFRQRLPVCEQHFRATPGDWRNDIRFFRLGLLCWFMSDVLKVGYKEDQREVRSIQYTDPSDLFLNGLIDTRQGTCGSLPVLFLALAWRMKWPVALITANNHLLCRFDNGEVVHNIEVTNLDGGFRSPTEEYLRDEYEIPERAIRGGSDLCRLSPKQTLGWFFGLRGRHHYDIGRVAWAERDYLFARALFPENRRLYCDALAVGIHMSLERFERGEMGHPDSLPNWICVKLAECRKPVPAPWSVTTDSQVVQVVGEFR